MIALLEARRAGLLNRHHWAANLVAGVTVGLVALPLAMAFAIASGAKPEQGLYTAVVASLAVSLFGGTRAQIAGPTGAFVVILSGVTARFGIEGLQVATLMAGAMLLLLGLARLGSVIRFIPDPVIVGFTSGIGVVIFLGQQRDFFGLPPIAGASAAEKLWSVLEALPQLHLQTTLLGLASVALILVWPRLPLLRRIPGPLAALVAATALESLWPIAGVRTLGDAFGGIPPGLPAPSLPHFPLSRLPELIGPAFAIALLGAIESLLSAVVADGMAGTRHDSNQELIGQGIANLLAPLFAGFAATGAIARTATSVRNGANSPIAGVVHALTLVVVILALTPLAAHVPLAVLAAILFVVAWNMSDIHRFVAMVRRAPRADVAILFVTFALTVFADLVVAVNIGVILATLNFMRRMAQSVEVRPLTDAEVAQEAGSTPPDVLVYAVEGPLFFGAVETFERTLAAIGAQPRLLALKLDHAPFIDGTGLQALESAITALQGRGARVVILGANARVRGKLERAGIVGLVGKGGLAATLAEALSRPLAEP